MPRAIWKGAISFGLVHVPVALYPASQESGIDFDWLDARSMDPVGYRRINKRTGKEIGKEHIVRGIRHGDGEYVVLDDDEIRAAYPRTTQTIELESFAAADDIPFVHLDHPYYLEPHSRGDKVYALLRDALAAAGKVGVGRLVIHTREHLCALVPDGPMLTLATLRWPSDIRSPAGLKLPPVGAGGSRAAEMKMARALIDDMSTAWDPSHHEARFETAVMALVDDKLRRGDTERVQPLEAVAAASSGNVVDLSELLRRSLGQGGRGKASPADREPAVARRRSAPGRRRARRAMPPGTGDGAARRSPASARTRPTRTNGAG